MLLDRIDIDAHGPLHRVELGPLSEGMNVVLAPEGAGKTAVVRFIRDSLVAREYPLGMMNSSTGRVVWADRYGLIHCRREQDGTPGGRRTIEFESRGEYPLRFDSLDRSWITGAADTTDASLSLRSIQLPESLVDGVITDTSVTHVARVVSACLRAGLNVATPARRSASDGDRVAGDSAADRHLPQRHERLRGELAEVVAELAELPPVSEDVEALTARREKLVRRLERTAAGEPVSVGDSAVGWVDREAIVAELRRLDARLAPLSRWEGLRRRQRRLQELLGAVESVGRQEAPLAREASRWLVRLSAGRLRRLDWNDERGISWQGGNKVLTPAESRRVLGVRIDGQDESDCSASDRALAVMAVRMAAAELSAGAGRGVPLVIETHRELLGHPHSSAVATPAANGHPSERMAFGPDPIAAALSDYVAGGHQLVVLTSSRSMADALENAGARGFRLHAEEVVHPHRPLWKSQHAGASYVGPHPQGESFTDPLSDSHQQINRDFDTAWREAYGIEDRPAAFSATMGGATDEAAPGTAWRDGVYYGHRYTTRREPTQDLEPSHREIDHDRSRQSRRSPQRPSQELASHERSFGRFDPPSPPPREVSEPEPSSPFFLTVDSPIDQAPSIDAVLAARLRGLGVTHIIHLMKEDANRLADTLGVANVSAAAIRRWQAECRLVCRVPQLRGFDARILVGCGITDPARLAAMPPMQLLERVEAFLATERGQRVLLSGTSYELCRITSWLASANRSIAEQAERLPNAASDRPSGEERVGLRLRTDGRRGVFEHDTVSRPADEPRHSQRYEPAADRLTFHLDRESPVEDLTVIGLRMAERLVEVGVEWIDDLLQADPTTLAAKLHHRRVDADAVRRWQDVAQLMCQIPELQGHEAWLLVTAGVSCVEALAEQEAESLQAELEPIVESREGRRMLRGKQLPGLEQVADWIASAARHQALQAA